MRQPSPQTELRNLRRDLKRTEEDLRAVKQAAEAYRSRATKAEQETAEWKRRFDLLLARTPEEPTR